MLRVLPSGAEVLGTTRDEQGILLAGSGASINGERPFVDRLDLHTLTSSRLWQSEPPHFEQALRIVAGYQARVLVRRESPTEAPNYFLVDLAEGARWRIVATDNPFSDLGGAHRELIRYTRADGLALSAMLHLPSGYDPAQGPLPVLVWAYPREHKDDATAAQVKGSELRFSVPGWGSPLYWLTRGIAVVDDPALPIVGSNDAAPNDAFVSELIAGADALVGELIRRGIADPLRIAIGGHSYGAFTAANLLAHTRLFCAGIARNGVYNRTLTPFGFQTEERSLWEAPETYLRMSPYLSAGDIEAPLLLIHGAEDANSGTHAMQSEFMFSALKGLGKIARLVILPYEGHQYRARASILHALWEIGEWLDKYVIRAD